MNFHCMHYIVIALTETKLNYVQNTLTNHWTICVLSCLAPQIRPFLIWYTHAVALRPETLDSEWEIKFKTFLKCSVASWALLETDAKA
jgi:hypothetical protein